MTLDGLLFKIFDQTISHLPKRGEALSARKIETKCCFTTRKGSLSLADVYVLVKEKVVTHIESKDTEIQFAVHICLHF